MKKADIITYRTKRIMKALLLKIAAEKQCTISQLSEHIIQEYLSQKFDCMQSDLTNNMDNGLF